MSRARVDLLAPGGAAVYRHNAEVETYAVAVVAMRPEARDTMFDSLSAEDFYGEASRLHFETIRSLHEAGQAIDYAAIGRQLGESFAASWFNALTAVVPASASIPGIIRELRENSKFRQLVDQGRALIDCAVLGTDAADVQAGAALAALEGVALDVKDGREPEAAATVVQRVLAAQDEPPVVGLRTGIADLDALLGVGGFRPGELVIVAAHTRVGKSVLGCQFASEAALRGGKPVVYFSLEMTSEELIERMAISEARVDATDVRDHTLSQADQRTYAAALGKVAAAPLFVDDMGGSPVRRVRRYARDIKRRHGLGAVVIDYLQLLGSEDGRQRVETRALELGQQTKALKALAKELRVPVVALCQVNRESAKTDRPPRLHDLRESGSIEQDSDSVLIIDRVTDQPEDGKPPREPIGEAVIYVAKRRGGHEGKVRVRWSGEYQRFDNLAPNWRAA